ncbi:hypothetical protein [Streptomyces sp. WAC 04229]|uniref:hypothetical protein n=1 Tax=Streptomyces sp. WAC 04229 TaxID=2203206 RepID=UPI003D755D96
MTKAGFAPVGPAIPDDLGSRTGHVEDACPSLCRQVVRRAPSGRNRTRLIGASLAFCVVLLPVRQDDGTPVGNFEY